MRMGDTYGKASVTTEACTQPPGYVSDDTDCDDGNAAINPGATEVCNLVDDNCDGNIDEGVEDIYYQDSDSDTYGNILVNTQACTQPAGYVADDTDCNDSNASINPGATEVCNGLDDNCDGQVDEDLPDICYPAELPRTGQTTCYDTAGAVVACAGTGQDGEIQAGVPWPDPRFTDNTDGTVTDNLTGLMWTKDGNAPEPAACSPGTEKTWQEALDYVACLNTNAYLGYTDWRLPNVNEFDSLVNAGPPNMATWLNTQGFSNVQSNIYWSSTSLAS